jgi:hypothetical protein
MSQFRGQCRQAFEVTVGITDFHHEVAIFDVAEIAKPQQKLATQILRLWVKLRARFKIARAGSSSAAARAPQAAKSPRRREA